jgi:hypothetical protein
MAGAGMLKSALVLALTLLPTVPSAAVEPFVPPSIESASTAPTPAPRPALIERFRLFSLSPLSLPVLDLSGLPSDEKRLFHQAGDPDSLFSIGAPTPGGEVHLKAAIEINETFLKAVPPDANVLPTDTRPRAAGSFLPLDNAGRPYQLRLGARLVW